MQGKKLGFTLVELVIVIIILGILAAVAVPKFLDLSSNTKTAATDAKAATTNSVAASLAAANAVNYTARKANATKGIAVTNCTDVAKTLQGGLPAGYAITSASIAADATTSCTLSGPDSTTAMFNATGIS